MTHSSNVNKTISYPTPHGEKLKILRDNPKLPKADEEKVTWIISEYTKWINDMNSLTTRGEEKVRNLVELLNEYKMKVELNLIWDSTENFLYRQKGQLKLDNSILEEWFPRLVDPEILEEIDIKNLSVGPSKAFSSAYFKNNLIAPGAHPMIEIRSKDQDFAIGQKVYIKSSFDKSFNTESSNTLQTFVAYLAAEIKTNLDKTMFQEAVATSHDLKIAAPGSKYFLICEYLDMTPISSAGTDIEEVLILRGKRTNSNERKKYSNAQYRKDNREEYAQRLSATPIREKVILHFINHIHKFLKVDNDILNSVERGYF